MRVKKIILQLFVLLFLQISIFKICPADESKIKNVIGFSQGADITKNKDDSKVKNSSNNISKKVIPRLKIIIDKKVIYHYEIQKVFIYDFGNMKPSMFHMRVYHNNTIAPSFGLLYDIQFRSQKKGNMLKAVYLPNWNADDGFYEIKIFYANVQLKTPDKLGFMIKRRQLKKIKNGLSVVDLEMNKRVDSRIIRGISGDIKGPEGILEWASFMNADALWILSGETTSFKKRVAMSGKKYWDAGPMYNLKTLEKYSDKYNVKIGAYIISFFVPGKNGVPQRYQSGIGYNSETDTLYNSRHISLSSENRIKDIINYAKILQKDPKVSYIGFDFIRTGRADGYELVDEFVKDLNIPVKNNWFLLSKPNRIKWLAKKIEVEKDPIIIEEWRWWRAHKVATILKRIINEAHIDKTVWVFTLGWNHGKEHGQDPVMFFDAGANIDAVMLYEANHNQYEKMMKQWQDYISAKQGNIIIGNCVDYKLLDSDKLTPPEELYRRNVVGYSEIFKDGFTKGIFFHDIYRLLWGRKGKYKSWEYALSYASSIFNMREKLGLTDILTDIIIKQGNKEDNFLSGYIFLKNLDEHSIDLALSSYPMGIVKFIESDENNKNRNIYKNSAEKNNQIEEKNINRDKTINIGVFDTLKIAFKAKKKVAFFRISISDKNYYFFPLSY